MNIDLGLDEAALNRARRREFPQILRNLVADGWPAVVVRLDAETALRLADDLEFAVEHRPTGRGK